MPNQPVGHMGRERNTYIDLLRAAAILPVLLTHWRNSHLTQPGSTLIDWLYSYLADHDSGVSLFFVISGFVITQAAMAREGDLFRMSYRSFYPRRFARIWPLLMAVCLIGIAALELSGPQTPFRQFFIRNPAAIFNVAFWASIFTFTFNLWRIDNLGIASGWGLHWDVMWSLAVEEQFYIVFPLLLFLAKNRARLEALLWGVILVSITYRLEHRWSYSRFDSLVCFELIAAGILAALYAPRMVGSRMGLFAIIGGLLLCLGWFNERGNMPALFSRECLAAGAAILLCCAVHAPKSRSRLALSFAFIGELSYGIYLLHPIVLFTFGNEMRQLGYIAGYLAYAAATTAIASLSYRFFEKPTERIIKTALVVPQPLALQRDG